MKSNKSLEQQFIQSFKTWLCAPQPKVQYLPELIGKAYYELESLFPCEFIPFNATTGILELTTEKGTICCSIQNGLCINAFFADNSEE